MEREERSTSGVSLDVEARRDLEVIQVFQIRTMGRTDASKAIRYALRECARRIRAKEGPRVLRGG